MHLTPNQGYPTSLHVQESTMQYILLRPDDHTRRGYSSLSESLQELRDLLSGTQDPMLALRHRGQLSLCNHITFFGKTSSFSHCMWPITACMSPSHHSCVVILNPVMVPVVKERSSNRVRCYSMGSSFRRPASSCGAEVGNDVLRDLLLAADMDINRAVNFFFNSQ